jgi:hypothetical protein
MGVDFFLLFKNNNPHSREKNKNTVKMIIV